MVPRSCTRSTIVRVWLGLRMNLIEYGGTEEFSSIAHIIELDGAAAPIVLLCILQEEVIYEAPLGMDLEAARYSFLNVYSRLHRCAHRCTWAALLGISSREPLSHEKDSHF